MPWIDPIDDYAAPPRLPRRGATPEAWDGVYEGEDGIGRIEGAAVDGDTIVAERGLVELLDVVATGGVIETDGGSVDLIDSTLTDCDLSRATIGTVRGTRFVGCKFSGTDLSERTVRDSVFERCTMQYTHLRMATLQRVAFDDCRLDDVDFSESRLEDVTFAASRLVDVNTERCRFERVDLRGTAELDLSSPTNLRGCLIDDAQVLQLAYRLALLAGATIERDPEA